MKKRGAAEERLVARCRERGVPVTAQRRAVLRALSGRRDHPTAGQVHAAASARLPGMTRATVYRVLATLESLGVVRAVEHAGAAARFEVDTGAHHHLVCTGCGRIDDLHEPGLESLSLPAPKTPGFVVREYSIQFRGLCGGCRALKDARRLPSGRGRERRRK
ncbi:MAG TPA: transcriptional repressor [Planctomycetota bacterium]|nr:transcriptional repressor [Planctomycetota bacterium]